MPNLLGGMGTAYFVAWFSYCTGTSCMPDSILATFHMYTPSHAPCCACESHACDYAAMARCTFLSTCWLIRCTARVADPWYLLSIHLPGHSEGIVL